jgi:hypothetical protein
MTKKSLLKKVKSNSLFQKSETKSKVKSSLKVKRRNEMELFNILIIKILASFDFTFSKVNLVFAHFLKSDFCLF